MKIVTDNLKSLTNIWSQARVSGIQAYSFVYLDFKNSKIKFMNEFMAVKTDLVVIDKEEHESMYIDGNKFFSLVNSYPTLEIQNDVFLSPDGDKFQLPSLDEDMEFPDTEYTDWNKETINFTPDFNLTLSSSMDYVEKEVMSPYSTLFFKDGIAVALNPKKMFFSDVTGLVENDFNIPYGLLKLINSFKMDGEVEFKTRTVPSGASVVEFIYNNIWIRYQVSLEYNLPFDPLDENFVNTFYHKTCFTIERNKLEESVKFLTEFFKDLQDPICKCDFVCDGVNNNMIVSISNTDNVDAGNINYKIPISDVSDTAYFNGKSVTFYLNVFKSVCSVANSYKIDNILIRFDENAPGMYFGDANSTTNKIYVVHTVIKE